MSWLFGIKTQPPPEVPPANTGDQQNAGPNERQGGSARASPDGSKFNYSFDSTALERAAKAAKELEKSPNAKQALELSRMQEVTKQRELELNQKVAVNLIITSITFFIFSKLKLKSRLRRLKALE